MFSFENQLDKIQQLVNPQQAQPEQINPDAKQAGNVTKTLQPGSSQNRILGKKQAATEQTRAFPAVSGSCFE